MRLTLQKIERDKIRYADDRYYWENFLQLRKKVPRGIIIRHHNDFLKLGKSYQEVDIRGAQYLHSINELQISKDLKKDRLGYALVYFHELIHSTNREMNRFSFLSSSEIYEKEELTAIFGCIMLLNHYHLLTLRAYTICLAQLTHSLRYVKFRGDIHGAYNDAVKAVEFLLGR